MLFFYTLLTQMFIAIYPPAQIPAYTSPLSIPIYISGNFGEIRPDHFHSGIDIKTQGKIGHKIFSIDEGYVSRIKIQANGYGNSIYINHPNGFTSVYGHLDSYCQKIDTYIKDIQYRRMSFAIDLFPEKNALPVSKGEFIAFSGNSGSSSGPHLHFELRKTRNQFPVNPLKFGFSLNDNTAPSISSLFVYPSEKNQQIFSIPTEYKTEKENGIYKLTCRKPLKIAGPGRFGIEVHDKIDGSSNSCGIYILELSIAGKVIYLFKADEFSFDESKYVNAHSDYRAEILEKRSIHLLYRKPNNRLSMYPVMVNDGIFDFQTGVTYPLRIRAVDAHGNESILEFEVEGISYSNMTESNASPPFNIFRWNTINYFENANIRLEIPSGSLYEDIFFEYARTDSRKNIYPYIHYLGNQAIPLHYSSKLSIFAPDIPSPLRSKTVIVKLTDKDKPSFSNGTWNGDWLSTKINGFGRYTVDVDTLPPQIIPLNIKPGSDMTNQSAIRYQVTDNLSGIAEYQGYIDDKWVLFEYDLKNNIISYKFDQARLMDGINHEIKFHACDGAGNESSSQMSFFW